LFVALSFLAGGLISAQQSQGGPEARIEIKIQGEINAFQRAKIGELLNYFKNQNPRLKIDSRVNGERQEKAEAEREIGKRESKVEKYHFYSIAFLALSVIFLLWLATAAKKEKKRGINLANNIFMGAIFLFSAASGVLLIYGYKFQGFDLRFWHVEVSLVFLFAVIFHFATHWKIWLSYFKKILGRKI
jgi:magnesium-transporting ATPase (P-type)